MSCGRSCVKNKPKHKWECEQQTHIEADAKSIAFVTKDPIRSTLNELYKQAQIPNTDTYSHLMCTHQIQFNKLDGQQSEYTFL